MVHKDEIAIQLANLGVKFRFIGRPELRELSSIINPGEQIHHVVNGFYQGGMALLVTTNRRLLLVDKKPLFLNLEDIRYEMISDLDFVSKLLDGTLNLCMSNKKLSFRSYNIKKLREMCHYVQDQITHFRQTATMINQEAVMAFDAGTFNAGLQGTANWQPYSTLLPRKRPSKFVSQSTSSLPGGPVSATRF